MPTSSFNNRVIITDKKTIKKLRTELSKPIGNSIMNKCIYKGYDCQYASLSGRCCEVGIDNCMYEPKTISKTDADGYAYWTAYFPEFESCVGGGQSEEEAIKEAKENLKIFLEFINKEDNNL